jgi:hypothetical protein
MKNPLTMVWSMGAPFFKAVAGTDFMQGCEEFLVNG